MKRKRLDFVAVKFSTFDNDLFVQDVINYSTNSLIIIFDLHKIIVRYKSPDVSFPWHIIQSPTVNGASDSNGKHRYNFTALLDAILVIFFYIFLASYLCLRYRPKVFWVHNLCAAFVAWLFKKVGMCDYIIYVASDWLVSNRKQHPVSYLANNIVFPIFDYLSCASSDLVLNSSERISEARRAYWGRRVEKHRIDYPIYMKIYSDINNRKRNKICFLGTVRDDSGLEWVIPLLPGLWKKYGIKLVIIGWPSPHLEKIERLIATSNAQEYVEFRGYLDYGKVKEVLDTCFCGLNLLTTTNSYSTYGIPGKLVDYLQMLIPLIITDGVGSFAEVVREKELGLVIKSNEELAKAIEELYNNNLSYQKNIQNYILNRSHKKIADYVYTH